MKHLKLIVFKIAAFLLIVISIEIFFRVLFFQLDYNGVVIKSVYRVIKTEFISRRKENKIKKILEKLNNTMPPYDYFFKKDKYKNDLLISTNKYIKIFDELVMFCKEKEIDLWILYIPSINEVIETDRRYFANIINDLITKYELKYIDMLDQFLSHEYEHLYSIPDDDHPTRFANQIITDNIKKNLEVIKYKKYKMIDLLSIDYYELLGDYRPDIKDTVSPHFSRPWLITNAQGLRRKDIVKTRKTKKLRILCIGDSFTFGHGLKNSDAYPNMLEIKFNKKIEVINAGIPGYTISSEFEYLYERGKKLNPDIIILQVMENDLIELYPPWQKIFSRKRWLELQ